MELTKTAFLQSALDPISGGMITFQLPGKKEISFGDSSSPHHVRVLVRNPALFGRVARGGSMALGESYMDGWWDVEGGRLVDLFCLLFWNKVYTRFSAGPIGRLVLAMRYLSVSPLVRSFSRRNVERHYDLSNDFFALFLDEGMTYSCGYQRSESDSIEDLQRQKYERIGKKLGLARGGKIVDVGCGWGGMLLHAAGASPRTTGVGVTLSANQARLARERIARAGLDGRLDIRVQDYRDLKGEFDFFVSIGMFEHVGKASYRVFMRKARELLAPEGIGLLHTIGLTEPSSLEPDPWTNRYIFPGSRLPRIEELTKLMREEGLLVGHVENLRPHYAATLRRWRERFHANSARIRALGPQFDDRFMRMWDYYLQISEATFRDTTGELYQILFCKGERWRFPMCFDF